MYGVVLFFLHPENPVAGPGEVGRHLADRVPIVLLDLFRQPLPGNQVGARLLRYVLGAWRVAPAAPEAFFAPAVVLHLRHYLDFLLREFDQLRRPIRERNDPASNRLELPFDITGLLTVRLLDGIFQFTPI